jgi:hypothetical protein
VHRIHLVATLTGHARVLLALDRTDDAVAAVERRPHSAASWTRLISPPN